MRNTLAQSIPNIWPYGIIGSLDLIDFELSSKGLTRPDASHERNDTGQA